MESDGRRASARELGDSGRACARVTLEKLLPTPCPPTPPRAALAGSSRPSWNTSDNDAEE